MVQSVFAPDASDPSIAVAERDRVLMSSAFVEPGVILLILVANGTPSVDVACQTSCAFPTQMLLHMFVVPQIWLRIFQAELWAT